MGDQWTYRANRAFGVLSEGEHVSFDDPQDPVLVGLVGAGYVDLVSGPPGPGIPSGEVVGTPAITQTEGDDDERPELDSAGTR